MTYDININPIVIDCSNLECLNKIYLAADKPGPQAIDLNDLAVEVEWSKKRILWMIYGSCHTGTLKEILGRVTRCSRVVVLEYGVAKDYYLTTLQRDELRQLLSTNRLTIITGGNIEQRAEKFLELVDIDTMDGWKPILSISQMSNLSSETRKLFDKVASGVNTKVMGKTTIHSLSMLYLRNALINAPLASGGDFLEQWKGMRKDKPALIVAAGPSLNKQLTLLSKNQDLFTIVAVDKVWPILKAEGIVPDVILAIDPISLPSWPRNEIAEQTAFCIDIGCGSKLLWSNDQNHLLTCNNMAVYKILNELGIKISLLSTGGSVATSAFALAELLEANPIIFIGQDLALTGGKDHADGYIDPYDADGLKERFEEGFDVEGYYGGRLRTERQLLAYKTWFESRINALPEKLIINATEGGARIEGAIQLKFETVCNEIRSAKLYKTPLIQPFKRCIEPDHIQRLSEGLLRLKNGINIMKGLAEEGKNIYLKINKNPNNKQLKELDTLNQALKNHRESSKLFIDILSMSYFEKMRYKISVDKDINGMADTLQQYNNIYSSIIHSAIFANEMIDHVIKFYNKVIEHGDFDPKILDYAYFSDAPCSVPSDVSCATDGATDNTVCAEQLVDGKKTNYSGAFGMSAPAAWANAQKNAQRSP